MGTRWQVWDAFEHDGHIWVVRAVDHHRMRIHASNLATDATKWLSFAEVRHPGEPTNQTPRDPATSNPYMSRAAEDKVKGGA